MKIWERYLKRQRALFRLRYQSPKQLFDSACELLIKCFAVCGGERMKPGYTRRNPRLIFLVTDLILYLFVNLYSIAIVWGSLMDVVFCFVTLGIAIQGLAKIEAFTCPELNDLHLYNVGRFQLPPRFPEVEEALFHTAAMCKVFIRILAVAFSIVAIAIYSYAILMPLVEGKLSLAFGFYLPFIDYRTPIGFAINWVYQFIQVSEGCIGLMACDTCLLFLIVNATGQMDLIIIYLRRLTELIDSNNAGQNDEKIADLIGDIVVKHLEHTKYVTDMDKLLKKQFFINFSCIIFELVASLAIVVRFPWYPGMAIALICTIQLFVNCSLGTYLSSKNDKLVEEIYNVNWYGLSTKHQKTLQQVLLTSQHPVVLSDGFAAIDLYNFVEIYKKIYSYLMVLQNMS
ncbi:odorant receptor 43a-like [Anopheles maculipalpis]|uniref:odorant receptor 43a-like n=1 Tax=Anopheles maculipalpis TaxID=1496333 RepID=UPI0021591AEF|nr:odorant receptor 43a-like [Anopheles maculipalpis]